MSIHHPHPLRSIACTSVPSPPTRPAMVIAAQKNILVPIFDQLSLPSIVSLMSTSVDMRYELQTCVRIAFHQLLQKFGLKPEEFRNQMRIHGAVTFGDDALKFMTRSWTEDSVADRLSFLVPATLGEVGFVAMLQAAGYTEGARTIPGNEFLPLGVLCIRNWARTEETKITARVRLFITFDGPRFIQALCHLPTSAHLSYITADSIHIFLPNLTLARRAVVIRAVHGLNP